MLANQLTNWQLGTTGPESSSHKQTTTEGEIMKTPEHVQVQTAIRLNVWFVASMSDKKRQSKRVALSLIKKKSLKDSVMDKMTWSGIFSVQMPNMKIKVNE